MKVCENCGRVYPLADGLVLEEFLQTEYIEYTQSLYHFCGLPCLLKHLGSEGTA